MERILELIEKEFITLDELEEIEESEFVEKTEFNGISGKDGSSRWYSIYLTNSEEYQVYVK